MDVVLSSGGGGVDPYILAYQAFLFIGCGVGGEGGAKMVENRGLVHTYGLVRYL